MIYVFKLNDGREYFINAEKVNMKEKSFQSWLESGLENNLPLDFLTEYLTFQDVKAIKILLHEKIKY
ncbi:hypothetical protein ABEW33_28455 [Priestia megaterium]|jgi:hypothetical protein|uniref:hypothetical protein n=1 Tax=Priestia megaterium TaxID=1404 RepID=UPI00034C3AA8|nr:hypothetical protein [Priestia megaterium]AYE51175.1 hypothetical protein OEA_15905 [Priestia megaterium NCT-2]UMZ35459.1 hypothetical protein MGJ28_12535 [Priestia megaterium]